MKSKSLNLSKTLKSAGISNKSLTAILGVIVALGGSYGGYTVMTKDQILNGEEAVYMSSILDGDTFDTSPLPSPW